MEYPAPAGRKEQSDARRPSTYRSVSLGLAMVFAATGLLFLCLPGALLRFFNDFSVSFGLQSSPVEGTNFYLILAAGYMYLVTLLAWNMFLHPANRLLPVLLLNAKLASSALSLIFFLLVNRALIYLANALVDGLICAGVFLMHRKMRSFK